MAQAGDIDDRLARLDAALSAAAASLDRPSPPDLASELDAARQDVSTANARILELEARLRDAEARADKAEAGARSAGDGGEAGVRLRAAVEALTATGAQLRDQQPGAADAALAAEVEALRAARAMDLAEMRALLAELEPMLEVQHA